MKKNLLSCLNIFMLACVSVSMVFGVAWAQVNYTSNWSLAVPVPGTDGSVWAVPVNNSTALISNGLANALNAESVFSGDVSGNSTSMSVDVVNGVDSADIANNTTALGGDATGTIGNVVVGADSHLHDSGNITNAGASNDGAMVFNGTDASFNTTSWASLDTFVGFKNGSDNGSVGISFVNDDVDGDYLLIATTGGYDVFASLSALPSASHTVRCFVFVDETLNEMVGFYFGVPATPFTTGGADQNHIELTAGEKLRLKCASSSNSESLNVFKQSLTAHLN